MGFVLVSLSLSCVTVNTPTEQWVSNKIKFCRIANLKNFGSAKKKRKIHGVFVATLLTNSWAWGNVDPTTKCIQIQNAVVDGDVFLHYINVPYSVVFEDCQFTGEVGSLAGFGGFTRFTNCEFMGPVQFSGVTFEREMEFKNCVFRDSVDFSNAEFSRSLVFNKCNFEGPVFLKTVRVLGDLLLRDSKFSGGLDARDAKIGGDLMANNCKFESLTSHVIFSDITVSGDLVFRGSSFASTTAFNRSKIGKNLDLHKTQFAGKKTSVSFNGAEVKGIAHFVESIFEGKANFAGLRVGTQLQLSNVEFRNSEKSVSFSWVTAGTGFLANTVFSGPVDFYGMRIDTDLSLKGSRFKGYASFASASIGNTIFLRNAFFENGLDLSGTLYKNIQVGEDKESWLAALDLIEKAKYSRSSYRALEECFTRQGYQNRADEVYIAFKRREWRDTLSGLSAVNNWLFDFLVGYGRKPYKIIRPIAFFIFFGMCVFRPSFMQQRGTNLHLVEFRSSWHSLLYSIDLFIPFADLHIARDWTPRMPKKSDVWYHNILQKLVPSWLHIHVLAGYILIPIAFAALTGLLR